MEKVMIMPLRFPIESIEKIPILFINLKQTWIHREPSLLQIFNIMLRV